MPSCIFVCSVVFTCMLIHIRICTRVQFCTGETCGIGNVSVHINCDLISSVCVAVNSVKV